MVQTKGVKMLSNSVNENTTVTIDDELFYNETVINYGKHLDSAEKAIGKLISLYRIAYPFFSRGYNYVPVDLLASRSDFKDLLEFGIIEIKDNRATIIDSHRQFAWVTNVSTIQ